MRSFVLLTLITPILAACVSGQQIKSRDLVTLKLANSTCELKKVRNQIHTELEFHTCKEQETLTKLNPKSNSYLYLQEFFSNQKTIAKEYDEKKISKPQYYKMNELYVAQILAKIGAYYEEQDQSAAAGRAMAGAIGGNMQQQSQSYQQRAIEPLPKKSYNCSSQNYGAYDKVNCY